MRIGSLVRAFGTAFLLFPGNGDAIPPLPIDAQDFGMSTGEFVDDFEAGVLNDGGAGEPLHYSTFRCGGH